MPKNSSLIMHTQAYKNLIQFEAAYKRIKWETEVKANVIKSGARAPFITTKRLEKLTKNLLELHALKRIYDIIWFSFIDFWEKEVWKKDLTTPTLTSSSTGS